MSIGCDICSSLLNKASKQAPNSQLLICDNLSLPFRYLNLNLNRVYRSFITEYIIFF